MVSHRCRLSLAIFLALLLLTTALASARGGPRPGSARKEEVEVGADVVARELVGPGSSPPTCRWRCGTCTPCRPVHVAIQPGLFSPLDYYPEAWRCTCGHRLFMPSLGVGEMCTGSHHTPSRNSRGFTAGGLMWKWKPFFSGAGRHLRPLSSKPSPRGMPAAVDGVILRSLKDHYLEASKMTPPPKVSPPAPFAIVKGALDAEGGRPVLTRAYGGEEVSVAVMRLASYAADADEDGEGINQLFLHVDVKKQGREEGLHFLCALYPDALGIHSVRLATQAVVGGGDAGKSASRSFQELDEKMRDALHSFVEERGINESLFPFLQAWLYVKDHRNLMRWFKRVGTFVNKKELL